MTKERVTLTIDKSSLKWIDSKIDKKIFANRSHALEFLVAKEVSQNSSSSKKENKSKKQ